MATYFWETVILALAVFAMAMHECKAGEPPKSSCYWKTCKMLNLESGFSQCEEGLGDSKAMVRAKLKAMAQDDHFISRCIPVGDGDPKGEAPRE